MGRNQNGHLYAASGAFYVRYWSSEIIDGKPKRVQRSERLCFKDDKFYSIKAKAVKDLREDFMYKVNKEQRVPGRVNPQTLRIADFWEQTFFPLVQENRKASTIRGYEQIWKQHLQDHFADLSLKEYTTNIAGEFLESVAKKQGKVTVAHIRALAHGIFAYALTRGLVTINPFRGLKLFGKGKASKPTEHYTLEEAENIISALVEHPDCQLIMALACFLGLRPGEIAGLRWEDFDSNFASVHIRRSIWEGIEGTTKTPESVATLRLPKQVALFAVLWHGKSANPSSGWVFQNKFGKAADLKDIVRRIIIPHVTGKRECGPCGVIPPDSGMTWKGLYAGRRGAGTAIVALTNGNLAAAQELLRHKNMMTTSQFYKKNTQTSLDIGIAALDLALGKKALAASNDSEK